jgi:hypothetical protein
MQLPSLTYEKNDMALAFAPLHGVFDLLALGLLIGVECFRPLGGKPRQNFGEFALIWPVPHDNDFRGIDVLACEKFVQMHGQFMWFG